MSTITPPSTLTPLPPPPIQTPLPLVQSDTSISSVGYNRLQSTIPASTPPIPPSAVDPAALSYLIISGGTGANSIAAAFGSSPAFVLPVSDDGGSSSEILRCFGGPSIGDIRKQRSHTLCNALLLTSMPRLPIDSSHPPGYKSDHIRRKRASSYLQPLAIPLSRRSG